MPFNRECLVDPAVIWGDTDQWMAHNPSLLYALAGLLPQVQAREAGSWPPPTCDQVLVDYSAPEEGVRDLALLEALLDSGAKEGQPVAVKQV
jgi:hypothetical protein